MGPFFRIWKRLNRAMVNVKWLKIMPLTTITHLSSVSSDHCPLLIEMTTKVDNVIKYFRFLNYWVEQPNFIYVVLRCWDRLAQGNVMWIFHQKLQKLANTLSKWSRSSLEDIHAKVKEYEDQIRIAEEEMINNNSEDNRTNIQRLNTEYIRHLKLEESILMQKSQLHWFKKGDANLKYFHALLRGRKRKLYIHKVQYDERGWIEGNDAIAEVDCNHFQQIREEKKSTRRFSIVFLQWLHLIRILNCRDYLTWMI